MIKAPEIIFPGLGITIENLPNSISIGGFKIAFYGIIIAIGMVIAVILAYSRAKKTNQYPDHYIDIGIISIIAAIIGARIYYVAFAFDQFKDNLISVFNIRQGGLAIYGGLIAGIIAAYFVCRYKKISFLRAFDTAVPGIPLAQALGRWGNFFNKEAYGGYTENLFRMQIDYNKASGVVTEEIYKKMKVIDGAPYIQVHPTFLYESAGCLLIFILIMIFYSKHRYSGEIVLWYVGGYALLRAFVEGLRTDPLLIFYLPVSQLLSVALFAGALALLVINRIRLANGSWNPEFHYVLADGEPGTKQFQDELKKSRREAKGKGGEENSGWKVHTAGEETPEGTREENAESPDEAAPEAESRAESEEENTQKHTSTEAENPEEKTTIE